MPEKIARVTLAEYLASEETSPFRREYIDGRVFAMAGSKRRHNLIVARLFQRARNVADGGQCQVFSSDMKVYVEVRNSVYYPDLVVCCDQDDSDELCVKRPCFLVEVLSPSTASVDRRDKRVSYERLPSLLECALVEQNRMRVELYQREGEGWQGYLLQDPDDTVLSSCLGLKMTLAHIYQDVEFPPPGVAEEEAEYV